MLHIHLPDNENRSQNKGFNSKKKEAKNKKVNKHRIFVKSLIHLFLRMRMTLILILYNDNSQISFEVVSRERERGGDELT